jgi:hypothetical protein
MACLQLAGSSNDPANCAHAPSATVFDVDRQAAASPVLIVKNCPEISNT